MKKLEREFYDRSCLEVSKELLGKYLIHVVDGEELISKIVEVEAYMGAIDKAAHSYNNRRTNRTEVMFGKAGVVYVFSIYGMYNCMNIVVNKENIPQAALIRAVEPIKGFEKMSEFRYKRKFEELNKIEVKNLTNGPGKLCIAMNIKKDLNGEDLCGNKVYLAKAEDKDREEFEIVTTKRINIDYAEEAVEYPWRFYIKDNIYISKK